MRDAAADAEGLAAMQTLAEHFPALRPLLDEYPDWSASRRVRGFFNRMFGRLVELGEDPDPVAHVELATMLAEIDRLFAVAGERVREAVEWGVLVSLDIAGRTSPGVVAELRRLLGPAMTKDLERIERGSDAMCRSLVGRFPALSRDLEENTMEDGRILGHPFFGTGVWLFALELVRKADDDPAARRDLRDLLDLLDRAYTDGHECTERNVIAVSFVESLIHVDNEAERGLEAALGPVLREQLQGMRDWDPLSDY